MKKFLLLLLLLIPLSLVLTGCTDADVAPQRLSKSISGITPKSDKDFSEDADMFRVERRVVFYDGITGDYLLSIEGLCSLGNGRTSAEISITCKTGADTYKKHFIGISDYVTYFVEQLEGKSENVYHYKVVFKPSVIIPDIEIK